MIERYFLTIRKKHCLKFRWKIIDKKQSSENKDKFWFITKFRPFLVLPANLQWNNSCKYLKCHYLQMILWCKQIPPSIFIFKKIKFSLWNIVWIFLSKQIKYGLDFEYVHLLVYLPSFRMFPWACKQKALQMKSWKVFC